jgi:hypothetical protein
MPHEVFISYSQQDTPTADAACHALEAAGIRCWIAPRDIPAGQSWKGSIVGAIRGARVMVLVFSGEANRSAQVQREVDIAFEAGHPIVPFRIENVQMNDELYYCIAQRHWLDALAPPLEQHIGRLVEAVSALVPERKPPKQAPHQAPSPGPARPPAAGTSPEPRPRVNPAPRVGWWRTNKPREWVLALIITGLFAASIVATRIGSGLESGSREVPAAAVPTEPSPAFGTGSTLPDPQPTPPSQTSGAPGGTSRTAATTGTITGLVTDAATGRPLAGVQLVLGGTNRGALTDQNGRFRLNEVPAGAHMLSAAMIGYLRTEQRVEVTAAATRDLRVQLRSQAVQLEHVVVTAEQRAPASPPRQLEYAAGQSWFDQDQPIRVRSREYVKFGLSRIIQPAELTRFDGYQGVPIFVSRGAGSPPEVIYVPIGPGNEFHAYQLRSR